MSGFKKKATTVSTKKQQKLSNADRSYRKKWETEKWAEGWLVGKLNPKNSIQAYCTVCFKFQRCHKYDLERHSTTETHLKSMENLNVKTQPKMNAIPGSKEEEKKRDLRFAAYIATHSSTKSMDHLSELLDLHFCTFKMHKTKCSNLIINVIAPNMLKELIDDIGTSPFSLIIDESTDVSTFKYLCLCVKYFSVKEKNTITDFLGLIDVQKADASTLYKGIVHFCDGINLNLKNLIGLGTDGGSNLCGKSNSVYTLLRANYNPNLELVRCVCHSLNNAASHASKDFPATIDFLCKEIYNWFTNNTLRRSDYRMLWNTINESFSNKTFHNFVQLSSTRWLARYNVVNTLLEHWLELKTYFSFVVNYEKCYVARTLHGMLDDNSNFLYLTIINPILHELNQLNLVFQKTNVNLGRAYEDLKDLILLLARKVLKPEFLKGGLNIVLKNLDNNLAYVTISQCDYGIQYDDALKVYTIEPQIKSDVEIRAFNYIKRLCLELSDRLPKHFEFYKQLTVLSPQICLNHVRPKFKDLPFLRVLVPENSLSTVETQWNKLLTTEWVSHYGEEILTSSYKFWPKVLNHTDAGGRLRFEELGKYMLTLLSFPSSNAIVERVFSVMNSTKTKLRNRMMLKMLEAILRIKCRFYSKEHCCPKFEPSTSMLRDFNYKTVYLKHPNQPNESNNNELTDDIEEEISEVFDMCENFNGDKS